VKNPLTPYQISRFLIHKALVENLWKLENRFSSYKEDAFPHPSTSLRVQARGKVENLFSTAATKGVNTYKLSRPCGNPRRTSRVKELLTVANTID
jgi:hypothetical protein